LTGHNVYGGDSVGQWSAALADRGAGRIGRDRLIALCQAAPRQKKLKDSVVSVFDRYLSLWVALCIAAGVALGNLFPALFQMVADWEYASVNLVVAVLIWAMVYPMMVAVDFASLRHIHKRPKGLVITLAVNWLIKPFTMAALGVLFFEFVFADLIDPADAGQYIAGLILLGAAPCTAMVFIWSQLTRGDANYTLVQVSLNDIIMIFAFAPIVALLLGVTDIEVPWQTLLSRSALCRHSAGRRCGDPRDAGEARGGGALGEARVARFIAAVKPFSILGLLATVVLLFGFQGHVILDRPLLIALIAVPLLIQSYGIFAIAYAAAWAWRVPHNVAAPCALIGTSNFFELAVAVAIGLFGLNSGAALVTVVGVLVEVPVMLSLVAFANRTRHHFPASEEPLAESAAVRIQHGDAR
jgi:arsenite transporter